TLPGTKPTPSGWASATSSPLHPRSAAKLHAMRIRRELGPRFIEGSPVLRVSGFPDRFAAAPRLLSGRELMRENPPSQWGELRRVVARWRVSTVPRPGGPAHAAAVARISLRESALSRPSAAATPR